MSDVDLFILGVLGVAALCAAISLWGTNKRIDIWRDEIHWLNRYISELRVEIDRLKRERS